MSKHDPIVPLTDMLDYALEIVKFVGKRNKAAVLADLVLLRALTHDLQIIGEAATRVPQSIRECYPQIDWISMVAMRHRLVHGYDVIDNDVLWDTIDKDIPYLIEQIPPIIEDVRKRQSNP